MIKQPGTLQRAIAGGLWPAAIWLAATATALAARPPMMSSDLPFHAAAWWAWNGWHDVAYLHDGGADWPPLLFWIIELGWHLFGVSELWPRLAAALVGLASLWVVAGLARQLWPEDPDTPRFSAVILAGCGGFIAFLATTSAAWLLTLSVMLALYGLTVAWRGRAALGWSMFAAALALGELGAGALALWHMVPLAMAAPLAIPVASGPERRHWYGRAAAATLLGLLAALAAGSVQHVPAEGIGATLARLLIRAPALGAATQPWGWHLLVLPLILYPWLWWTSLWWAIGRSRDQLADPAIRLCLAAAGLALLVTLASGRQAVELLVILPPLALAVARLWAGHARKAKDFHAALPGLMALFVCLFFFMLNIIPVAHLDAVWRRLFDRDLPIWLGGISLLSGIALLSGSYLLALLTPRASYARLVQLALLPVLLALTVNLEFAVTLRPFFDLQPVAHSVGELQRAGRPIAVFPRYDGELDLAGRLSTPPVVLSDGPAALSWAAANPEGVILSFFRGGILHLPAQPLSLGNAEDYRAALWASRTVTATGGAVLAPRF